MYNTQDKKEKALLVVVSVKPEKETWTEEEIAAELKILVESTGIEVVEVMSVHLKEISAGRYIGKGKCEEIAELAQGLDIDVVIFNNNLTATQQRNLEDIVGVKTIDRTQLILDIFAAHAHTQEGALQVELAQLEYLLPRLKGKGIMLSRLGGGIGTRGPGERKIEIDRRRIDERITRLRKELENVRKHRDTIRKKRQKEQVQVCSLVGYTNAGKSTLLNTLTGAGRETSDSLFTTLDPVSRTFTFDNHLQIVITDTVGFIYKLPPYLVESFKATLEELQYADLLLHVVDVSNENYPKLIKAVDEILKDLELNEKHQLLIFNKIDRLSDAEIERMQVKYPEAILVSALTRANVSELLAEIQKILFVDNKTVWVTFNFAEMKILDWLYRHASVIKVNYTAEHVEVKTVIKNDLISSLEKKGAQIKEIER
ncbi:MAG: GTPase HflX [Candidatus Omnitrophica bacterium]|nr:GTPase HflX [Candidatus Omnitrophota bacterium]